MKSLIAEEEEDHQVNQSVPELKEGFELRVLMAESWVQAGSR
jgi:hypothetical protein